MITVPEHPRMVKAVAAGPGALMVSWAPPERPLGRLTHYTVHWTGPGSRTHSRTRRVDAQANHALLQDLSPSKYQVIFFILFLTL